jgi:hypothetical protein
LKRKQNVLDDDHHDNDHDDKNNNDNNNNNNNNNDENDKQTDFSSLIRIEIKHIGGNRFV